MLILLPVYAMLAITPRASSSPTSLLETRACTRDCVDQVKGCYFLDTSKRFGVTCNDMMTFNRSHKCYRKCLVKKRDTVHKMVKNFFHNAVNARKKHLHINTENARKRNIDSENALENIRVMKRRAKTAVGTIRRFLQDLRKGRVSSSDYYMWAK